MGYDVEKILKVYREQAEIHGNRGESTIQDIRTRQLEMKAILSYLEDGKSILEVGCGNGFVAEEISRNLDVDIHAIDFSKEMIDLAKERNLSGLKGRVKFECVNILNFQEREKYDIVFTERCIQNILDWELQKVALKNIALSLKKNGKFIMLETFIDSYDYLNRAREELDLPIVKVPFYNLPFDPEKVIEHLNEWMGFIGENRFLSGYYFGTRLLYPSMLPKGKEPVNSSVIKDYFVNLPNEGDFSPMKILCFTKK